MNMRRKEKEIRDIDEINRILDSTQYITLAMCDQNRPYLVTLSHGFDLEKNCLYFHCASSGKKIDILKSNPRIWGQAFVDRGYADGQCDHLYESVHFQGLVTFIETVSEKRHALRVMIQHLEENPDQVMARQLNEKAVKKVAIGRIDIQKVYGKRSEMVIISKP
jgi:nitroimidazol reductase NimA-like FMN-containing flavoprotein (pyridoxamine 5'-phosphate oxidase superfamily)